MRRARAPSPGWTSEKSPRRRSRGPRRPGAGEAAFVFMSPVPMRWKCRGRRTKSIRVWRARAKSRRGRKRIAGPGGPRLSSTVDPWRLWDACETGVGPGGAGVRRGVGRVRRGDANRGGRPAVQGRRVPPVLVRGRLPRPLDDPDRGARARPPEDRRRADARPRGRPGAGPRPGLQGSRREGLHLPLPAQAPGADAARVAAGPLAREGRPGPELPHPPGGRPHPDPAAGGRRHRPHEPPARGGARRPGSRRVPQDLRGRVRHDRRVPAPRRGGPPRLHGRDRDRLHHRPVEALARRAPRTGSTAGPSSGRASSTSGWTTSTATAASGAGCGFPGRTSTSPSPRTRTWSSSTTTGC